jgi:hypothetical protein
MRRAAAIVGLLLGLMAGGANASPLPLQGRDINGNPVDAYAESAVFEYDPNLNITWLRDWDYPNSISGIVKMNWPNANNWATNLIVGSFSGWRLPMTNTGPSSNCSNILTAAYPYYSPDNYYGSNCTGSPMGYLWYTELGNVANSYSVNRGPFLNMKADLYWTSTEYAINWYGDTKYWIFEAGVGWQGTCVYYCTAYSVAVRDGDVATSVPEPATVVLLSLSLGAMGLVIRGKQARRIAH